MKFIATFYIFLHSVSFQFAQDIRLEFGEIDTVNKTIEILMVLFALSISQTEVIRYVEKCKK